MTKEEAILWMQVLKQSKVNWVGDQAEDEDIIARCEEAEQEAFDMAIEALQAEYEDYEHATLVDIKEPLKVLVVRCKDCQYRKKVGTSYYCELDEFNVQDADFCSWGERKEP